MKEGLSQDAGVNYPPGFLIRITRRKGGVGGGVGEATGRGSHKADWSQVRHRTHAIRTLLEAISSLQSG